MESERLLEEAAKWEALVTASLAERGPFTKRFCAFKAAQLRQRAAEIRNAPYPRDALAVHHQRNTNNRRNDK